MLIVNHLPPKNPSELPNSVEVQKKWSKVKGKFAPLIRKNFLPNAKLLRGVNSKIDYDAQKEHAKFKKEQLEINKDELDFRECTFHPDLNQNSLLSATQRERIHITDREVPPRYQRAHLEEAMTMKQQYLMTEEMNTMKIPSNIGKKINEKFYTEKLDWKTNIEVKNEVKRVEQKNNEGGEFIGQPKIMDYSKNQIVRQESLDSSPFLERVQKNISKKGELIKTLESKYYNYPFKPTTNNPPNTEEPADETAVQTEETTE